MYEEEGKYVCDGGHVNNTCQNLLTCDGELMLISGEKVPFNCKFKTTEALGVDCDLYLNVWSDTQSKNWCTNYLKQVPRLVVLRQKSTYPFNLIKCVPWKPVNIAVESYINQDNV